MPNGSSTTPVGSWFIWVPCWDSLPSSAVRLSRFLATWSITTGFLGCWLLYIYFTSTTKACMPDLTRSINGLMKSEGVLLVVTDRLRRVHTTATRLQCEDACESR